MEKIEIYIRNWKNPRKSGNREYQKIRKLLKWKKIQEF